MSLAKGMSGLTRQIKITSEAGAKYKLGYMSFNHGFFSWQKSPNALEVFSPPPLKTAVILFKNNCATIYK